MTLLAACWLGMLLTVAAIATPAPFAVLSQADAGRVASRILAHEAAASAVLGALLLALQRVSVRRRAADGERATQFDSSLALAAGALLCTVAGHYAILPMMAEARAGRGPLTFAQLHLISAAFYAIKTVLVAALAWSFTRPRASSG